MKIKKLHLGCGGDLRPDMLNVDMFEQWPPEGIQYYQHDLNQFPWPWNSNSFDYVEMNHCLEHLQDPVRVLESIYRILKPEGKVLIRVPHHLSHDAHAPDHFHYFGMQWFTIWGGTPYYHRRAGKFKTLWLRLTVANYKFRWNPGLLPFVRAYEACFNLCPKTQLLWEMAGPVHPGQIVWVGQKE